MLKRSLLFLTVLLIVFSFSSITNEVSASSSFDKGKYKKGDDASYFEPTGPYLMVNVTGVDGKGNELLSPHYVEFPIKPGTTLTKEKIEYYVEWALDATAYKEFRVVELDPSAKIEVTYYDKNKKKEETKSFPITEKVLLSQIYQSILKTLDST